MFIVGSFGKGKLIDVKKVIVGYLVVNNKVYIIDL